MRNIKSKCNSQCTSNSSSVKHHQQQKKKKKFIPHLTSNMFLILIFTSFGLTGLYSGSHVCKLFITPQILQLQNSNWSFLSVRLHYLHCFQVQFSFSPSFPQFGQTRNPLLISSARDCLTSRGKSNRTETRLRGVLHDLTHLCLSKFLYVEFDVIKSLLN